MISYFQDGIKEIKPSRNIEIPQLVKLIKNHPNKDLIEQIRNLRIKGDEEYKKLKKQLPHVTPNCVVKVRSLTKNPDDLEKNLISFSQYLFFDIDINSDVDQYKKYFIEKYGHLAHLVCKSCSGGGLSVFFQITNPITTSNFDQIWNHVSSIILQGEPVDPKCKNIGRAMFISSDPEVWVNYDNEIELDLSNSDTLENKKEVKQCNSYGGYINTLVSPFSRISFDEILKKVRFETLVEVENPILDFKPVNYTRIFVPKEIKDGTKHQYYTRYIHSLVFLNPEIEKDYILSFLFFVNSNYARPRMDFKELVRLFFSVYNVICDTGSIYVKTRIKNVHFNRSCDLSKSKRTQIANYLNGAHRRSITVDKIRDTIQIITNGGRKVTQKEVARLSGLNVKTVRTHFHEDRIDMEQVVRDINLGDYAIYDEPEDCPEGDFNELCFSLGNGNTLSTLEL